MLVGRLIGSGGFGRLWGHLSGSGGAVGDRMGLHRVVFRALGSRVSTFRVFIIVTNWVLEYHR